MKKIIISTILTLSIATLFACGNTSTVTNNTNTAADTPTNKTYDLEENMEMPNIIIETNQGYDLDLSKTTKPALINFWATWCPPCNAEMPGLQKLYEEYGDDIDFIMINLGESKETVTNFLEKKKVYTFPIGFDEENEYGNMFKITAIPTTYIIDANKKIVKYQLGAASEEDFRKYIEDAINNN